MSTTLYRKYRPQIFAEVVDQNHIKVTLQNEIESGKIAHAYLFSGPRGVGKTTIARILAKALNCRQRTNAEPCERCASCEEIKNGRSLDLIEIDAASNRGINEIRELREQARVTPAKENYKVFIIDEVHMLSKDAWGALLKTLEEPPKHVIFILATTELQKVPETIISRCQVFTFKKASDTALKKMLMDVAKAEGFELDVGSAELLAILADGSFRDGLGELQKVLNFHPTLRPPLDKGRVGERSVKITREDVESITGAPKTTLVNNFISSIAEKNIEKGILAVQTAAEENLDMRLYLKLIIEKFRLAIILRYAPKLLDGSLPAGRQGDISEADLKFLQELVKKDSGGMLRSPAISTLLESYQDIDNAFIAELPLELALIKILGEN